MPVPLSNRLSGNSFAMLADKTRVSHQIKFYLNGGLITLKEGGFDPNQTLADWLRSDKIGLKGTKITCNEGGCGACTVLVSTIDPVTHLPKHRSINSCIVSLGQMHNTSVTTIEALGSVEDGIQPLQQKFVENHATQCGYCTPGFIMNAYALFLKNPHPTKEEIDDHFDGNLCRCTGYAAIEEAIRAFADKTYKPQALIRDSIDVKRAKDVVPAVYEKVDDAPVQIGNYFVPTSVSQVIDLLKEYPDAQIIAGNSEGCFYPKNKSAYISVHRIPELNFIRIEDGNLVFGAATTLQDILEFCEKNNENGMCKELVERLKKFSSTQVRSSATVIGNIAHGGAVTDMTNFCMSTDAKLDLINCISGEKSIIDLHNFFLGIYKTALRPGDFVTKISIPLDRQDEYTHAFKQARRRDDDICFVSATIKAKIDSSNTIKSIRLAYSGMGECPKEANGTAEFLKGKKFTLENIQAAYKYLERDLQLPEDAYRGNVEYRKDLSKSFLFRYFHEVQKQRGLPYDKSAVGVIERNPMKFKVECAKVNDKRGNVGTPYHHKAAVQQTTGEALYTDDTPLPPNGLYAAFIMSTIPHGIIKKTDFSAVLKHRNVVDIVTAKDIRGLNSVGDVMKDEPVFADKEVMYVGQPIGLVLATNEKDAWAAAKLASIEYERLPEIVNIDEAIKANSFYPIKHQIKRGDLDKAFSEVPYVLENNVYANGQEHFYFETHNALCIPGELNKLDIYSSTQNPTFLQAEAARVNGLPSNLVSVHVKRLGGGFGGKETRSSTITNSISVAALKTKRPIKMQLPRDIDMTTMGQRHPSKSHYKIGFTKDGIIKAVKAEIYTQAGWSLDLSQAITDRALFHADSAYYIENFEVSGHLCKTNTVSNTAFRGFGGPQGFNMIENAIEQVASYLKVDPDVIRRKNLYRDGQTTHFGVPLIDCKAEESWDSIYKSSEFAKRKELVKEFNRTHKYKKRGISITPLKFGISFTYSALNQAGSLVHIYKDGSVLVSHGGTEMGQGLYTKMCQIAASTLDVPIENIHIEETATDKVANTSATAASSGADLNGQAVKNACDIINARLRKYRTPDRTFKEAVLAAWNDKVDLCAHGFYSTPNVFYDWERGVGNPFAYYTYGAAASEVEIDTITGDHQIIRSDIIYDAGKSLNTALDVGQVTGAFMNGVGWLTLEEPIWGDRRNNKWVQPGVMWTNGPGRLKIPGMADVPMEFNVKLHDKSINSTGIYSSKAIGEPPFLLAFSVAFALCDAIRAARKENGLEPYFTPEFPMTACRIREYSSTRI